MSYYAHPKVLVDSQWLMDHLADPTIPVVDVFAYCAIGGRSAYTWLALEYLLGYPKVRNYDRSWNEWSRLSDSQIGQ